MGNRRMVILGWLVRDLDGLPAWGNIPPESMQPVTEATTGGEAGDTAAAADLDRPAEPETAAPDNDNEDADDDAETQRHAAE